MTVLPKIFKNDLLTDVMRTLGVAPINPSFSTGQSWNKQTTGRDIRNVISPVDGVKMASIYLANEEDYELVVAKAKEAFEYWRNVPAPKRGEIVRQIGNKLREHKESLSRLVTFEMGKIFQEAQGEVQEMIDICDFAVGLSRQLYGLTMHSERTEHRMYEQWHPLGVVGIISAFNFPVAVWSWNAMLAAVCGDVCIWKPSEKTPLTGIACQYIIAEVLRKNHLPEGIFNLIIGDSRIGEMMSKDTRLPLISATGSTRMGKKVGAAVGGRLGRSLLELGGNNALIITPEADLELSIRAVVFGSVGTAGQRCTTTRRLIVHESMYEEVRKRLISVYERIPIGNPMDKSTLVGPLIDQEAVEAYKNAIMAVTLEGGTLVYGGEVLEGEPFTSGTYVRPTLIEVEGHYHTVQEETFAPILYLIRYSGEIEQAIEIQNSVNQGLSSAIFSNNIRETERFLSASGSDCGIANVNIGTSGAEIGGAFGGEKETGGGRESGSDSWKAYMRRQTNTINYSKKLPLAQGIEFDI